MTSQLGRKNGFYDDADRAIANEDDSVSIASTEIMDMSPADCVKTTIDVAEMALQFDTAYRSQLDLAASTTLYLNANYRNYGDVFYMFAGDPFLFIRRMRQAFVSRRDALAIATFCFWTLRKGMTVTVDWLTEDGKSEESYECILVSKTSDNKWIVESAPWTTAASQWDANEIVYFDPCKDTWYIPQHCFTNF
jgi:hypothetical protein